jgi:hypothetical protein
MSSFRSSRGTSAGVLAASLLLGLGHVIISMRTRLLSLLVIILVATPLYGQRAVADPLTLFARMMPVLSHERCVNCHGATNPYTGDYHPGAVPRGIDCSKCHTASPKWDTAPLPFAFFKKTTRQLCTHFEILGPSESSALHLELDELIGLAFIGRRGNAVGRQWAAPPPMNRREFVRAYRTWVRDGGGVCSAWEGTITRTETIATDTTPGSGPNARNVLNLGGTSKAIAWQTGTHTYTVTIKNGEAKVAATLSGEKNHKTVTDLRNCQAIAHVRTAYSLVSTDPPGGSDDTSDSSAGPVVANGDGFVRVGLAADGSFRIHVVPPREKTQETATTTTPSTCGATMPAFPANTETSDWPSWVFEIVGKLANPKDRTHIKGQSVIDVESSHEPSFGLAYHADVARLDGTSFKFRVTTTWDLSRVP